MMMDVKYNYDYLFQKSIMHVKGPLLWFTEAGGLLTHHSIHPGSTRYTARAVSGASIGFLYS